MSDSRENVVEFVNKVIEISGIWWILGLVMVGFFGI